MAFSKQILNKAFLIVEKRKNENEKIYENAINNAMNTYPELSEYEKLQNLYGSQIPLVAMSGNQEKLKELQQKCAEVSSKKAEILKKLNIGTCPTYTCPLCSDSGYKNGKLCDCVIKEAKSICYSQLSADMPLNVSTFANFDLKYYPLSVDGEDYSPLKAMQNTLKICKDFVSTFPNGTNLLFTGDCGLGKTHLSLAIVNEVIAKGYGVIYASAQSLIRELSKEYFNRNDTDEKTESVLSCDLLVLDDLGTEFVNSLSTTIVYDIINTRLLRGLSTIISTNLSLEDLSKLYDQRVVSRIVGNYHTRQFLGNDIRQIKALNK